MIDFPANPTVGQQFTAAGVTWTWDGTKWTASGLGVAYLPLAGGTMLGPIVLAADPAAALQPATKQYVDGGRLGDNRLINGDMRIDQRNNGTGGTAIGVYTVDRWYYNAAQASKGSWQRTASALAGFPYQLVFLSSSAYTALATDFFHWQHVIEADFISDFAWGTANAQPVTLSFWVLTTQTGTFSGSIRNTVPNRSYVFTFSIPTTNVWTRIVVNIPGDTVGTWTLSGSGPGLYLSFNLGGGVNYLASTPNAWVNGNFAGAVGSVSTVAVNGAAFQLTGVKLEIGSVATPFNRQSLAQALAACQRYYQTGPTITLYGYTPAVGNSVYGNWAAPVTMRATPTIVSSYSGGANVAAGPITAMTDNRTLNANITSVAAGVAWTNWVISSLSAEL